MRRDPFILAALLLCLSASQGAHAQNNPRPTPTPRNAPAQPARETRPSGFDLSEYGVRIQPEPRLIVMMAALDQAGFDPTPAGQEPSPFRAQVRRDLASLDESLGARMQDFYRRNKLPGNATPAEQSARYVSLAYALGAAPGFEAPARTDDLPAGLLEVMDFAPLVREFYRKSGIDERLASYTRLYQAEGDRLRQPVSEMVRQTLSYLHTRPITTTVERIPIQGSAASKDKKDAQPRYTVRERERRFYIVPDLLAAPGAINFRVIADDYYAIVPLNTNPGTSELRRAYLQYVFDPLVLRHNKEIALRREQIRQLLTERIQAGASISTDVFLAMARSLVAAAEARLEETQRLDALTRETQERLARIKEASERERVVKESQSVRTSISDEALAQLADAYERGAVLAFYFADQLRGIDSSGFDVANFLADMIASFDPAKESVRLKENAGARERALAARKARQAQTAAARVEVGVESGGEEDSRRTLVKKLIEVDDMLRLKNYEAAEMRLKTLLQEFPGEPRIFFALGEAASLSARDALDSDVQSERLNRALGHYRMAINASSSDTDAALLSRANEAMGRILAFLDLTQEAMKAFDAAIQLGPVPGGAYNDAVAGKRKLTEQK
jgi:hypothetical protein